VAQRSGIAPEAIVGATGLAAYELSCDWLDLHAL
jgi:hypothetical protein